MEELKRVYFLQSVLQLHSKEDCDENASITMKLINSHYSSEDNKTKPVQYLIQKSVFSMRLLVDDQFGQLVSVYFQNYRDLVIQIDPISNKLIYPGLEAAPSVEWPIRQVDEMTEKNVIRSTKVSLQFGDDT